MKKKSHPHIINSLPPSTLCDARSSLSGGQQSGRVTTSTFTHLNLDSPHSCPLGPTFPISGIICYEAESSPSKSINLDVQGVPRHLSLLEHASTTIIEGLASYPHHLVIEPGVFLAEQENANYTVSWSTIT